MHERAWKQIMPLCMILSSTTLSLTSTWTISKKLLSDRVNINFQCFILSHEWLNEFAERDYFTFWLCSSQCIHFQGVPNRVASECVFGCIHVRIKRVVHFFSECADVWVSMFDTLRCNPKMSPHIVEVAILFFFSFGDVKAPVIYQNQNIVPLFPTYQAVNNTENH